MNLTNNNRQIEKNKGLFNKHLIKTTFQKVKSRFSLNYSYFFKQKDYVKQRPAIQKEKPLSFIPIVFEFSWFYRRKKTGKCKQNQFNKRGQGLIEYLILIALMGVATIGIIRTLNQTVKSRFANAIYALQGKNQKAKTHTMKKEEYQRSDLSNFMSGSASADKKTEKRKR